MNLSLARPLVFFDIEGTGLDTVNDRIISIALQKRFPDNKGRLSLSVLVNPERPIPAESTAIHGITDADVTDAKPFTHYAQDIYDFLTGCDLAGFGCNHYDIPLLYHEFQRAGLFWDPASFNSIDVGIIFKIKEARTLEAAMWFYCGLRHESAHEAMADTKATVDVFEAQLLRYADLPRSVEELALLSNYGHRRADISGKFYYDEQEVCRFNFGPHKGNIALDHPDYLEWIWNCKNPPFPADTRLIVRGLLNIVFGDNDDGTDDDNDPYYLD